MTEENIWKMLREIPDPEIPVINIVELGIVRDVQIRDEVPEITITPTYSGCPAMNQIEKDIISNLRAMGCANAVVKNQYSPAWTTDWLTAEAKNKLMDYGISPPAHSSMHKKALLTGREPEVVCPRCKSTDTQLVSQFGSTACKALYKCRQCLEPFDHFKCL